MNKTASYTGYDVSINRNEAGHGKKMEEEYCLTKCITVLVTSVGFGFDGVEQVNYTGGEMMYTNPAYSTVGDEDVVTFESKPKL